MNIATNERTLGCIVTSLCLCLCLGTLGACGSGGGGVKPDSGAGSGGTAGSNTNGPKPDAAADTVGGSGGADASGDVKAPDDRDGSVPGDDRPTDRGPIGNACVAAGGTCIPAGRGCDTPGDPRLDIACGNPSAMHCCMPLPDSGARDAVPADGPLIGPDGKFACGNTSCDPTTHYCMGFVGGVGGDRYNCQVLPTKCGARATCACVQFSACPYCDEQNGAVLLKCPIG
ncbi:MAG TPA: hypothetical protein VFH73_24370 [Polyangia bacterium]|jgi:hypothetical protein|nr:hypothetical protein [Polyangia bacterium]